MHCMKCGKEILEKQAFCDQCLEVMEQHPINPGTKVWLPSRPAPVNTKKSAPRRRVLPIEEKLARSKKAIQWLSIALAIVIFALVMTTSILVDSLQSSDNNSIIGQNYNTVDALNDAD